MKISVNVDLNVQRRQLNGGALTSQHHRGFITHQQIPGCLIGRVL